MILKLYEEIITLRESKGRRDHLREMSVALGTLSSKLSESLEFYPSRWTAVRPREAVRMNWLTSNK